MRLLNAKTLELTQFAGDIPPYAILSHTWGAEEVTFQDITSPERDKKKGFAKILGCCRQALMDTLEWVWIDTCCIDKTSSAELSEAINSMYAWYRDSQVCYVYLEDVFSSPPAFFESEFRSARWFTRGWCLQELIAPQTLEFFNSNWHEIGSKFSLCDLIRNITMIPRTVLLNVFRALEECSVAQKMSWASQRHTTRIEDEAYCLLGIFGVNMPMLYGEGDRAFLRLQEEIIRHTEDYSFLFWTVIPELPPLQNWYPVCAPRPAFFHPLGALESSMIPLNYQDIRRGQPDMDMEAPPSSDHDLHHDQRPAEITSRGLRILLSEWSILDESQRSWSPRRHLVWTGFMYQGSLICITLTRDHSPGPERYLRSVLEGPGVQLVEPEMALRFERREMYLAMTPRTPQIQAISKALLSRYSNEPAGMEVALLSSSDRTAITMGETNPALPFQLVTSGTEHPGAAAGLTQLWRAEIPSGFLSSTYRFQIPGFSSSSDPRFKVSLTFLLDLRGDGAPESANYSSEQVIRVVAHLTRFERCTCVIEEVSAVVGSLTLPEPSVAASDRSQYALRNGDVAVASIKRVTREGGLQEVILRVAVLQGRLPKSRGL
jgi:hypothetical protein